jgi:hypothetical protein
VIGFLANEVRMLNERLLEALYVPVERRVLRRPIDRRPLLAAEAAARRLEPLSFAAAFAFLLASGRLSAYGAGR